VEHNVSEHAVKLSDDYKAKIRLWAANPTVVESPQPESLPRFGARRFNSHAEMNDWKRAYLRRIAQAGGCRWNP
jgi:hypothetical protein